MALLAASRRPHRPAAPVPPGDDPERGAGVRFLLYSHDGVGLGHVRRNLNVASALTAARPDASVLIATGAEDLDAVSGHDGVDVLRLPGLRKLADGRYGPRRLVRAPGHLRDLRGGLLAAAVEHFRPDVVLADKHPGGAQGELVPALERLRAAGGRAALGLRDVLDVPERARRDWQEKGALGHLVDLHDRVLVYGQAELLDPLAACGLPARVRERARFCGYVVPAAGVPARRPARSRPVVWAMAGGGEDGTPLLRCFLAAAAGAGWDARVVTGPHASSEDRAELEHLANAGGVRLAAAVRDLGPRLNEVDAVVCMGGYNTLAEVLAAGVPAVCVPRVAPRAEQLLRARAFAGRGLIRLVEPADLDPGRLRREVVAALATDRRALARRIRAVVDLNGAHRAAAALLDLADVAAAGRGASPGGEGG